MVTSICNTGRTYKQILQFYLIQNIILGFQQFYTNIAIITMLFELGFTKYLYCQANQFKFNKKFSWNACTGKQNFYRHTRFKFKEYNI